MRNKLRKLSMGGKLDFLSSLLQTGTSIAGDKIYQTGDYGEASTNKGVLQGFGSGASMGAKLGSNFGGLGTLIGAGVGGVGGAIYGYANQRNINEEAKRLKNKAGNSAYRASMSRSAANLGNMKIQDFYGVNGNKGSDSTIAYTDPMLQGNRFGGLLKHNLGGELPQNLNGKQIPLSSQGSAYIGNSHEQGGIPILQEGEVQPKNEIEGGEVIAKINNEDYVFSAVLINPETQNPFSIDAAKYLKEQNRYEQAGEKRKDDNRLVNAFKNVQNDLKLLAENQEQIKAQQEQMNQQVSQEQQMQDPNQMGEQMIQQIMGEQPMMRYGGYMTRYNLGGKIDPPKTAEEWAKWAYSKHQGKPTKDMTNQYWINELKKDFEDKFDYNQLHQLFGSDNYDRNRVQGNYFSLNQNDPQYSNDPWNSYGTQLGGSGKYLDGSTGTMKGIGHNRPLANKDKYAAVQNQTANFFNSWRFNEPTKTNNPDPIPNTPEIDPKPKMTPLQMTTKEYTNDDGIYKESDKQKYNLPYYDENGKIIQWRAKKNDPLNIPNANKDYSYVLPMAMGLHTASNLRTAVEPLAMYQQPSYNNLTNAINTTKEQVQAFNRGLENSSNNNSIVSNKLAALAQGNRAISDIQAKELEMNTNSANQIKPLNAQTEMFNAQVLGRNNVRNATVFNDRNLLKNSVMQQAYMNDRGAERDKNANQAQINQYVLARKSMGASNSELNNELKQLFGESNNMNLKEFLKGIKNINDKVFAKKEPLSNNSKKITNEDINEDNTLSGDWYKEWFKDKPKTSSKAKDIQNIPIDVWNESWFKKQQNRYGGMMKRLPLSELRNGR